MKTQEKILTNVKNKQGADKNDTTQIFVKMCLCVYTWPYNSVSKYL